MIDEGVMYAQWLAVALALGVSLLTMYNAIKLKSGILAISTYAFGGGMLCLVTAFALPKLPLGASPALVDVVYNILFFAAFLLLGFGSYKIYRMSQV